MKISAAWHKGRLLLRILLVVAVLGALAVVLQPVATFAILETLFPRIVWRVSTSQPLAALSFDDGPVPAYTGQVLEILARHGAKATFFAIGSRAAAHPWMLDRIRREGHEVGNHYLDGGITLADSPVVFLEKVRRAEQILGIKGSQRLFRPPSGLIWPAQIDDLERSGYRCVLGSAYPYDPTRPPVAYMRWLVVKNLRPGTIVILHDGIPDPSKSIAALRGILLAGAKRGLRFVTVSRLLEAQGK